MTTVGSIWRRRKDRKTFEVIEVTVRVRNIETGHCFSMPALRLRDSYDAMRTSIDRSKLTSYEAEQ
ncbi:hypothetical protein ACLQ3K_25680 [Tsukamurella sp. DT100]|uniref:hypothetical protein n=1 Tax=Tsukamurella sp. DT100 TaxID=3393415 RepID=UPI003CF18CFA